MSTHDEERDEDTLLAARKKVKLEDEEENAIIGMILVALSGIVLSVVSVLLKISAQSLACFEMTWLAGIGRWACLWCMTRPYYFRSPWQLMARRCILGWLGFTCVAFTIGELDLGTATAIATASWRIPKNRFDFMTLLVTVTGVAIACRPILWYGVWLPYASACVASLCSAGVGHTIKSLNEGDFSSAAHANAVFALVVSPIALLFTDAPVLKVIGTPRVDPIPLAAAVAAGAFDVAGQLCVDAAIKRAPSYRVPVAARALDVGAAFAWQHLLFSSPLNDRAYFAYSPAPDHTTAAGAALLVLSPLLTELYKRCKRRCQPNDDDTFKRRRRRRPSVQPSGF